MFLLTCLLTSLLTARLTARLPRPALDRARGLQRLEVVLRRAYALEAEGAGDFGLRGRETVGLDALGEEGEDLALGVGQIHG